MFKRNDRSLHLLLHYVSISVFDAVLFLPPPSSSSSSSSSCCRLLMLLLFLLLILLFVVLLRSPSFEPVHCVSRYWLSIWECFSLPFLLFCTLTDQKVHSFRWHKMLIANCNSRERRKKTTTTTTAELMPANICSNTFTQPVIRILFAPYLLSSFQSQPSFVDFLFRYSCSMHLKHELNRTERKNMIQLCFWNLEKKIYI